MTKIWSETSCKKFFFFPFYQKLFDYTSQLASTKIWYETSFKIFFISTNSQNFAIFMSTKLFVILQSSYRFSFLQNYQSFDPWSFGHGTRAAPAAHGISHVSTSRLALHRLTAAVLKLQQRQFSVRLLSTTGLTHPQSTRHSSRLNVSACLTLNSENRLTKNAEKKVGRK